MFINGEAIDFSAYACARQKSTKYHEFDGHSLEISGLHAAIEIKLSSSSRIELLFTGPSALISRLNIDEMSGIIFISGPCSADVNLEPFTLDVRAPQGTNVHLCGIANNVSVIDLDGDLTLNLVGPSRVYATQVNNLDIKAAGETNVTIESIRGDATIRVAGSSRVDLKKGTTDQLHIMALDSCRVDAQVTARKADLDAFGASAIQVKAVVEHCQHAESGASRIGIG